MTTSNIKSSRDSRQGARCYPRLELLAFIIAGMLVMPIAPILTPTYAQTTTGSLTPAEFSLAITPAAPNLPADTQTYFMNVQLLTVDGNPVGAPIDTEIGLITSDPTVVSLPLNMIILEKGESIVKAELETTSKPGIASITASAQGIKSTTESINTISLDSLDPTKLAIYAAPSSFIPDPEHTGLVYVQLLNSQGLPSVTKETVFVSLSSSESVIATVPSSVTIPRDQSGVLVDLTSGQNLGQTTITASAAGLSPGSVDIATSGPVATKLVVEFAPDVIAAEAYSSTLMSIQLRDANDIPVKAGQAITVQLRSTDSNILNTLPSIQIPAGKSYASQYVDSKGKAGEATITATASGLDAGFATIKTVPRSSDPSLEKSIIVYSAPSILTPDNSQHSSLVVAFFDSAGQPVEQTNQIFQNVVLSSSNNDVGTVDNSALAARKMYGVTKFNTHFTTGTTTLTAALAGYSSAQTDLLILGSAPKALSLYQIPGIVQAADKTTNSLVVSLIDESGYPVAALEDTAVSFTSSDPEIATVDGSVVLAEGTSYALTGVHTTSKAGETTISASADELDSGLIDFKTAGFTGSISAYTLALYTVEIIPADGSPHEAIVIQMQDQNGNPVNAVSDVPVALSSSSFIGGKVQSSVTIPKGTNYVTAIFTPSKQAVNEIKITGSSQGFQSDTASIKTTLQRFAVTTTNQPTGVLDFGATIPIIVDVFFAENIPVEGAVVSVALEDEFQTLGMTDASGHFKQEEFQINVPGQSHLRILVSKAGYEEVTITPPITVNKIVTISVGVAAEAGGPVSAEINVKGPTPAPSGMAGPGSPIFISDAQYGKYTLTAKSDITTPNAIYKFLRWSDGSTANPKIISVRENTEITAIYSAQYLLRVESQYGTISGSGYYPEGTNVPISVSPTSIGGILVDKNFGGWSGDTTTASSSANMMMDSPKSVKAIWTDSYLKVFLIVAAAAGGGVGYYLKVFRPKREMEAKDKAPDLDWFKS